MPCVLHCRARTKVAKQRLKLHQQKQMNIQSFTRVFIDIILTLIEYRMPSKLDYCFIMSTNLECFYLDLASLELRNETEAANNAASTFLEHAHNINHIFRLHKCACTKIKVGVAVTL